MATRSGLGRYVVLNDRVSTGACLAGSSQVLKILAHRTEMSYRLLVIMCQGSGRCSRICYSNRETGGRRVELRWLGAGVF
jgi:flavoprotein